MKKKILIIGAGSDVAQALSRLRAERGHVLWLTARSQEALQPLLADLKVRYQVEALGFVYDAELHSAEDLMAQLPGIPDEVHVAMGYLGNPDRLDDPNDAARILKVNFSAAVLLLNAVMSAMIEKQVKGVLVGISSVAGERGRKSNFLYGAAKAGFSTYLDGLRNAGFSHGIHVMTVKPGFIRSKMTVGLPLPGPLTASPQQVASAIIKGMKKGRGTVYVLPVWSLIMLLIRNIPDVVFKRLNL